MLIIKSNKSLFLISIIFLISLFFILNKYDDIRPISRQLKKDYKEYFLLKDENPLDYIYNNYNNLTPEEMISLNMIDNYNYKPLININSTELYVHEYFKLTNKIYDETLIEKVIDKNNYFINKYKYYVLFIKFIKYCLFLFLLELIYRLIMFFRKRL